MSPHCTLHGRISPAQLLGSLDIVEVHRHTQMLSHSDDSTQSAGRSSEKQTASWCWGGAAPTRRARPAKAAPGRRPLFLFLSLPLVFALHQKCFGVEQIWDRFRSHDLVLDQLSESLAVHSSFKNETLYAEMMKIEENEDMLITEHR